MDILKPSPLAILRLACPPKPLPCRQGRSARAGPENPVDPSFRWDDKSRLDSRVLGNDRLKVKARSVLIKEYLYSVGYRWLFV